MYLRRALLSVSEVVRGSLCRGRSGRDEDAQSEGKERIPSHDLKR